MVYRKLSDKLIIEIVATITCLSGKDVFETFKADETEFALSFGQLLASYFHLTAKSIHMIYSLLIIINNKLDYFCQSVMQVK